MVSMERCDKELESVKKRKRKKKIMFSPCDYDKPKRKLEQNTSVKKCSKCEKLDRKIKRQKTEIASLYNLVANLSGAGLSLVGCVILPPVFS